MAVRNLSPILRRIDELPGPIDAPSVLRPALLRMVSVPDLHRIGLVLNEVLNERVLTFTVEIQPSSCPNATVYAGIAFRADLESNIVKMGIIFILNHAVQSGQCCCLSVAIGQCPCVLTVWSERLNIWRAVAIVWVGLKPFPMKRLR